MRQFRRGDLRFDVADRGPRADDAAVLLHGWPQDHTAWDGVTPILGEAGLRTLAPDQRGYSPGARPAGRAAYAISELVTDVVALLDAASLRRVHLVGHDWGGAVAWAVAQRHPERLASLTVVSTPHPAALAWAMTHSDQALRSWYMLAFQLPWLPELVLGPTLPALLRRLGLPGPEAQRYAVRFREPGAGTAELNWYRAMPASGMLEGAVRRLAAPRGPGGRPARVTVPTTLVWGSGDPALGRAAAERTGEWVVSDYRFVEVPGGGHWLPETEPALVAREVLERARG